MHFIPDDLFPTMFITCEESFQYLSEFISSMLTICFNILEKKSLLGFVRLLCIIASKNPPTCPPKKSKIQNQTKPNNKIKQTKPAKQTKSPNKQINPNQQE